MREIATPLVLCCCSVVSDSLLPHGYSPPSSCVHGDSPGKNTGVDCHALLQRIFPTQGSNPGLPHCRRILYCVSDQGSHGSSIFNILRKLTIILNSDSTNLYSQSYLHEISFSAHPCQYLLFVVFWIITILTGVR